MESDIARKRSPGEIRMNTVVATGRLVGKPVKLADGSVHFRLQAQWDGPPFHCFCLGKTAENFLLYRQAGDEVSIEGELQFFQFSDQPKPSLLVKANFASYGRKQESLQPGDPRGGIII